MEDKSTCQILTDKKLEKFLSPPVKGNTFIKSYYDGLVFIFPKAILITRIEGTIPTAKVIQVKRKLIRQCFAFDITCIIFKWVMEFPNREYKNSAQLYH